jgi:fused signal recognition particle receptor
MALFSKIFSKLRGGGATEADWSDLRTALIEADLGAAVSASVIEYAQQSRGVDPLEAVKSALLNSLSTNNRALERVEGRATSVLVVGVNGTGKTTSVAKLMSHLKKKGEKVVVVAADTFRAAAIEQLQTWGVRLGVEVVAGKFQGDPASVVFDGARVSRESGASYLIVDTAGRLHTKSNLMDELAKIERVLEKSGGVDEVLLVIDATTGQNGINQAKHFMESVKVSGLILTKMDGSAKGGIAFAIERETGIPIKFIGTGEGEADLESFEPASFIEGLLA